jgi:hypothetical protein
MENQSEDVAVRKANTRTVKILIASYLFLCCLVVGVGSGSFYLVKSSDQKAKASTATEQAVSTNAAATSRVVAATAAIKHATEIVDYEIFDTYDSNPHHWDTGIEDNDYWRGVIGIKDGAYVWDIREGKESYFYTWHGFDQKLAHQDFDLSVDAKLDQGSSDLLCYGVAFRASPRDFDSGAYMFLICDSGVFGVAYHNDVDGSEEIIPWTRSGAIQSGDVNTISVRARGENITLLINNMVVDEFKDKHVIDGYVYLLMQAFDNKPGIVSFDNFAYQPR